MYLRRRSRQVLFHLDRIILYFYATSKGLADRGVSQHYSTYLFGHAKPEQRMVNIRMCCCCCCNDRD